MDFHQIYARINNIAEKDPVNVPPRVMTQALQEYERKFKTSKDLFAKWKSIIPSGIEHMNTLPKDPFPIIMARADGAYLYDVDGNAFIDYLATSGPDILGHNYPEVREYVIQVIKEQGPATGLMTELEYQAAGAIQRHYKSVEQVRFYQSGTEANMAAVRLARAYTGKKKIIKLGGHYHGWADQFVYDLHIPNTGPMFAAGIPPEYFSHTVSVPPNNLARVEKALKRWNKEGNGGVAAIILEPVGGDSATFPLAPDYNKGLRSLCDQYGALLIFDEVVTGFRLALGGAQEYCGVNADITTFGKIIGHEYPSVGAIGGPERIMQCLWQGIDGKGGDSAPFTAGTMAGTNVTCAAVVKTIECLEKTGAIEKAASMGAKLSDGLNALFAQYNLPWFTYNIQSIVQLWMAGFYAVSFNRADAIDQINQRRANASKYALLLALEGVNTLQTVRMYTTLAHKAAEIHRTIAGFEAICQKIKE